MKGLLVTKLKERKDWSLWYDKSDSHVFLMDSANYKKIIMQSIKRWIFDNQRTIYVNGIYLDGEELQKVNLNYNDGEISKNFIGQDGE